MGEGEASRAMQGRSDELGLGSSTELWGHVDARGMDH